MLALIDHVRNIKSSPSLAPATTENENRLPVIAPHPMEDVRKGDGINGNRLLIIAPHPDDEAIATGGIIADAVKRGYAVKVVIVTNGDGYETAAAVVSGNNPPKPRDYIRLGKLRQDESLAAARILGLSEDDIIFLGYPDGGMRFLWDTFWNGDPWSSKTTAVNHAPYADIYEPKAPYTGQSVVDSLSEIIKLCKPTDIYYPSTMDQHHDHWAVGAFTEYTLRATDYDDASLHAFLIHHNSWPLQQEDNKIMSLTPPHDLNDNNIAWENIPLTPSAQQAKSEAINQYTSQITAGGGPFLKSFIRTNELFIRPYTGNLPYADGPALPALTSQPYTLITHKQGSGYQSDAFPTGHLIQLNGLISGQRLWLGLKTDSGIQNDLRYTIHMRLFYGGNIRHMDFTYNNGKWHADSEIEGGIYGKKWLYLAIPMPSTPQYIYLNADVKDGDNIKDMLPLTLFSAQP